MKQVASKSHHQFDGKKEGPTDGATRLMTPQLRRTAVMKQGAQLMEPRDLLQNRTTNLVRKRLPHRWSHVIDDATIAQNRCDETRGSTDGAMRFASKSHHQFGAKKNVPPMEPRHLLQNRTTNLVRKRAPHRWATRLMTPHL